MNVHNRQVNNFGINQIDFTDIPPYLQVILIVYFFR